MTLLSAVIAFVLALCCTHMLSRPGTRWRILDYPNERSLHSRPTPRTGGLAILVAVYGAGIVTAAIWPLPSIAVAIAGGVLVIAAISFLDDGRGVAPVWRMLVHLSAAVAMIAAGLEVQTVSLPGVRFEVLSLIGIPLSVLFVVWMVNLYNFMDGIDGLAGGMAVIGFASLALFGTLAGDILYATTSLSIAAAAAGFLVFNFPPARIFMGDTGSSSLGFLAATLVLWGERDGILPLWAALLIFSPFIVDASVTLLQRIGRGEKIWQAHKRHFYQRLVQIGWGHKKALLWEYVLILACAASALWGAQQTPRVAWFILTAWMFCYALLILTVSHLDRAKKNEITHFDAGSSDS